MTETYEPPSAFLKDIVAENVPLSGSEFGKANLRRLIAMTQDADRANRDWATLLLSQQEVDTNEVRAALVAAASDDDAHVRGEAILGLAQRDCSIALPFIQEALQGEFVCLQIFEAAVLAAHPSLVDDLRSFADGDEHIDRLAREALAACEKAASTP